MLKRYRRISDIKNAGFVREKRFLRNGVYSGTVTFSDDKDGSADVIVEYYPRGGSRIIMPANKSDKNLAAYIKLIAIYEKMEQTREYKKILIGRFVNETASTITAVGALVLGLRNLIHTDSISTGIVELTIAYAAYRIRGWVLRA